MRIAQENTHGIAISGASPRKLKGAFQYFFKKEGIYNIKLMIRGDELWLVRKDEVNKEVDKLEDRRLGEDLKSV